MQIISELNIDDQRLHEMGGKAKSLALLRQKCFPVPEGFVITADQSIEALSQAELMKQIDSIGGFPVVVRSSAINEDGAEQSFAGIYESFLNVNSCQELIEKIISVRESAHEKRAQAYQKDSGTDKMSVFVQKQVDAVFSGVMFTIHPMTGNENEILIECVPGLAEELVLGRIQPKTYVLNSEAQLTSISGANNWSLPEAALRELVSLSQMLATFWGRPQDVEWCCDKAGKIWIVQSRPITKIFYRQDQGEWSNADFRDGGVSAAACLPLMASIYDRVFQSSLVQYFRDVKLLSREIPDPDVCGYFYGRLYWNASVVKGLLKKIPGFNEQEFDEDLGIHRDYGQRGPVKTPMSLNTILPFLPILMKLQKAFKTSLEKAKNYDKGFAKEEQTFLQKIKTIDRMSDTEFSLFFQEVMNFHFKVESDYFTVIYNSTNFQSLLKDNLKSWNKKLGLDIQYMDLISDLGEIAHMRVNAPLFALTQTRTSQGENSREFQEKLNDLIKNFYFYSDRCLDLTVPRWGEEPKAVLKHLHTSVAPVQKKSMAFDKAMMSLKEKTKSSFLNRIQIKSFFKQIAQAREFLVQREEMRDKSTRLYYFVRIAVVELGRRLEKSGRLRKLEDIFYLRIETLLSDLMAKKDDSSLQEHVIDGRLAYHSFLNYPSPNEFGMVVREEESEQTSSELKGLGCSAGISEGIAFVAHSLEQAQDIPEGHILVAPFTEPGWTPLFPRLSGVVTEVGGLLSHAAVISREFNLPAVLNVPGATQKIRTGTRIRIDGRKGRVEYL